MSLSDFPDNTTSIVVTVVILVLVVLLFGSTIIQRSNTARQISPIRSLSPTPQV
jgi:hypothetical protein